MRHPVILYHIYGVRVPREVVAPVSRVAQREGMGKGKRIRWDRTEWGGGGLLVGLLGIQEVHWQTLGGLNCGRLGGQTVSRAKPKVRQHWCGEMGATACTRTQHLYHRSRTWYKVV